MILVGSSRPNKTLKLFSSKLYKIRNRSLDFLVQNIGPFTTPRCNDVRHVRATDVFRAFAGCIWLRMYSRFWVGGLEYYIPVALCVLSVNLYHYHNLKVSCSIFVVYGCKFYQQRTRN